MSAQTLNNVHVRAMNGRVILTGQVESQTEKQKIESQVRQTPGVRMVINQLRVGSAADATGTGGLGTGTGNSGVGTGTSGNTGAGPGTSSDNSGVNPSPR